MARNRAARLRLYRGLIKYRAPIDLYYSTNYLAYFFFLTKGRRREAVS